MAEILRYIVPFFTALFQIVVSALAIGMFPALWVLARARKWRMLVNWTLVTIVAVTAAVYGLPLAHVSWEEYAPVFSTVSMWIGYGLPILFVPMIIPEPLHVAKRRVRKSRMDPEEKKRRKHRKKRREHVPGEIKVR